MALDIEEQYEKIYRYCYYRLHDREQAEDITQEIFLFVCVSALTSKVFPCLCIVRFKKSCYNVKSMRM